MKIASIDHYLSELILEKFQLDKIHFEFFAFLFGAAREGHLYTCFSEEIEPCVLNGWEMEVLEQPFKERLMASYRVLKSMDLSPFVFFEEERVMLKIQKEIQDQIQTEFERVKNQLFLITGGPGTGKTTFVKEMLRDFEPQDIALLAPTGKAANHLKSKVDKEVESGTLYSFLKKYTLFPFKCIVIDESSMIDAYSMKMLLQGVDASLKLYLVGDPNQLPPIQGGSLFADFVRHYQITNHPNLIERTINYRIHSKKLLEFATAIKEENLFFFDLVFSNQFDSIQVIEDEIQIAYPFFSSLSTLSDPVLFFEKKNQFVILTPFNQGENGVKTINQKILALLLEIRKEQVYVPVLLTKSIHAFNLFNGEIGMLILEKKEHYSFLTAKVYFQVNGKIEMFEASHLHLELAFCLSIHKSQGSEYDEVLLILDKKAHIFGKELLYTAATRAKMRLFLKGEKQDYLFAAQKQTKRLSHLLV